MSEHIEKTIGALQEKIKDHEREIAKVKSAINQLLEVDGKAHLYTDADLQASGGAPLNIMPDEFFGAPLATSVKRILELRRAQRLGPATNDELYAALMTGGYVFDQRNEGIAKRNVAITLSKNPVFVRLPNGTWGVREFYDKIPKRQKEKNGAHEDDGANADGTQDGRDNKEEV